MKKCLLYLLLTIFLIGCSSENAQKDLEVEVVKIEDEQIPEETEKVEEVNTNATWISKEEAEARKLKRDSISFDSKKEYKPVASQKYDPFIGMTDYEAIESTWGKPTKINKTTTAYGVREQWVYPNYKYLYFEDGYLTTIQE